METAVKERLVGAVVLVGLIVALVPEMLSGPRQGPEHSAASGDGAVRTFTVDLAPSVAQPTATPAAPENEGADLPSKPAAPPAASSASESEGKPPTVVTARAEARPAKDEAGWAVQLGSFASSENAERLASEVRRGGYRAFVSRFEAGGRVRYRVRVGPEQDRAQAEALAQRLQRDGRQVSIVSHP